MSFNFRIFIRALGAVIYAGIFTHTALTVNDTFGLNAASIIFLVAAFSFYSFIYTFKFHRSYLKNYFRISNVSDKDCDQMKYAVLIFNFVLTLYGLYLHEVPVNVKNGLLLIFENALIAFPEFFVRVIEKLFGGKK